MISVLAGIGAVLRWLGDGAPSAAFLGLGFAALGIVLMPIVHLTSYLAVPRRVKRLFRQQTSLALVQCWHWSSDGLTIENAQGVSRHAWGDLFGWRETASSLLFYLNADHFYALPRRAISADAWTAMADAARRSSLTIH